MFNKIITIMVLNSRKKYFKTLIKTSEWLAITIDMNNTPVCITARIS